MNFFKDQIDLVHYKEYDREAALSDTQHWFDDS